jgi:hypothetical protein
MKIALLLFGVILVSGCASPNDPDQVQLGPSPKEQRRDARQEEAFARDLPPPRP